MSSTFLIWPQERIERLGRFIESAKNSPSFFGHDELKDAVRDALLLQSDVMLVRLSEVVYQELSRK